MIICSEILSASVYGSNNLALLSLLNVFSQVAVCVIRRPLFYESANVASQTLMPLLIAVQVDLTGRYISDPTQFERRSVEHGWRAI